jgi:hypothetical protein
MKNSLHKRIHKTAPGAEPTKAFDNRGWNEHDYRDSAQKALAVAKAQEQSTDYEKVIIDKKTYILRKVK